MMVCMNKHNKRREREYRIDWYLPDEIIWRRWVCFTTTVRVLDYGKWWNASEHLIGFTRVVCTQFVPKQAILHNNQHRSNEDRKQATTNLHKLYVQPFLPLWMNLSLACRGKCNKMYLTSRSVSVSEIRGGGRYECGICFVEWDKWKRYGILVTVRNYSTSEKQQKLIDTLRWSIVLQVKRYLRVRAIFSPKPASAVMPDDQVTPFPTNPQLTPSVPARFHMLPALQPNWKFQMLPAPRPDKDSPRGLLHFLKSSPHITPLLSLLHKQTIRWSLQEH